MAKSINKRGIDLTGPDGNAFALIAIAKRYARQANYNDTQIRLMVDAMTSGDYDNLLNEFLDHWGHIAFFIGRKP